MKLVNKYKLFVYLFIFNISCSDEVQNMLNPEAQAQPEITMQPEVAAAEAQPQQQAPVASSPDTPSQPTTPSVVQEPSAAATLPVESQPQATPQDQSPFVAPEAAVPAEPAAPMATPAAPIVEPTPAPVAEPTPVAQPQMPTPAPAPSAMPSMPSMMPTMPQIPGSPTMPSMPSMPSMPTQQGPSGIIQDEYKEAVDVDEQDDEDSGNWYEKRKAWKRARPKYDEIRKLVSEVDDSIQAFFDKNKESEKELENFYLSIGVQQGEIQKTLDDLIEKLEKEKKSGDGLSELEKKELSELTNKKKKDLEQLKTDLESLKKINEQMRVAILETLMNQVKLAKSYEDDSLESYYFISKTLNDKSARNKLTKIETNIENVEAIKAWISSDLNQYVSQSISKSKEFMSKIRSEIDELKKQGVVVSEKLAAEEMATKLKKEKEEEAKKRQEAEKNKGFFRKIWDSITSFFSSIWNYLTSFIRAEKPIEKKTNSDKVLMS